ncbi:DUF5658 family protein [Sporosarcina sp. A2]|uniref:DUF5658 family protein n=1 Tax=Sporosarcina sp. A2 TaxID=3393449 RepID=UPI003D7B4CE2
MQMVTQKGCSIRRDYARSLWLLLILSLIDAGVTDFGLHQGLIQEANPLMAVVYELNRVGFYFIKLGLPISLFVLQPFVSQSSLVYRFLQVSVLLYIGITCMHGYWLLIHFST